MTTPQFAFAFDPVGSATHPVALLRWGSLDQRISEEHARKLYVQLDAVLSGCRERRMAAEAAPTRLSVVPAPSERSAVEVNTPVISVEGTHLCGYLDVSYEALVAALGEPLEGEYKTDAEWHLRFPDGDIATIYNYKTGPNYLGAEGTPVDEIRDWHVGGHPDYGSPEAAALVERVRCVIVGERQP